MWGSEPSQQWENLCAIIVFWTTGCPPGGYGISFYHDCTPPAICCGVSFVFGLGVYLLVGSSLVLLVLFNS